MTAGIEVEKCPKCEVVVYDAEGFPAGIPSLIKTIDLIYILRYTLLYQ